MIADTSLKAYRENKPRLQAKEQPVLDALRIKGPMTNEEIAAYLGWKINHVTGRTNRLHDKLKLVRLVRVRKCKVTGNSAKEWEAVPQAIEMPGLHRIYTQGRNQVINQMTLL